MFRNNSPLYYISGAAILAIMGLDLLVLRGQEIFHTDAPAVGGPPISIPIEQANQKHTLLLRTGGEYPLQWPLSDPEGREVASKKDFRSKKGVRRYSFAPRIVGSYQLTVSHRGSHGSSWSRVDISVRINDRRTITAWVDL